jgi:sulfur carrier protein ThiS
MEGGCADYEEEGYSCRIGVICGLCPICVHPGISLMKLKVTLYGTLSRRFPDYRHGQGMEVEVPEGGTVRDLLALLNIPDSLGPAVASEGRVLKPDDRVGSGSSLVVFQAVHGG